MRVSSGYMWQYGGRTEVDTDAVSVPVKSLSRLYRFPGCPMPIRSLYRPANRACSPASDV